MLSVCLCVANILRLSMPENTFAVLLYLNNNVNEYKILGSEFFPSLCKVFIYLFYISVIVEKLPQPWFFWAYVKNIRLGFLKLFCPGRQVISSCCLIQRRQRKFPMKYKIKNLIYLESWPLGSYSEIFIQISKNIFAKTQLQFFWSYQKSGKITFYPQ